MLQFDPETCRNWQQTNITRVSIEFASTGCEGTSVKVHEDVILDGYKLVCHINAGTAIYSKKSSMHLLENAYITHTGNKWIMKSESILTRCGCGKSFGIKTGDPKIDKIRLLKSQLAKKKLVQH